MKRQPFIWASLQVFRRLCNALPHSAAVSMGASLGRTVERHSKKRAGKARARCARILGVSEKEAALIVNGSYAHFGRSLVEFLRMPQMASRLDDLVSLEGEEHLNEAVSRGKGVIFLSAHIGNWEYGAALLARRGFSMNAIGADQRDPRITNAIAELRKCAGVTTIGKGLDLKGAISCLRGQGVLAVLLDQDAREAGIISPFLGFPASTPIGPIKMAKKFGSPVVPVRIIRNPDGVSFSMEIQPALQGKGGEPFGEDIQYAADECNRVLSDWIRETPAQWLWMYPRWATTLNDR